MTSTVDESWDRILGWLTQHAPATLERIGPPAADADIAAAEEAVGARLPADLVAWWRLANGSASSWSHQRFDLLPGYCPFRIEHALDSRRVWWQVWHDQMIGEGLLTEEVFTKAQADPAGTEARMWLLAFLPIAGSGGADLFVDLRSGPRRGCVREFDRVSTDGEVRWGSVTAMLADIADALDNHGRIGGYEARPDEDGVLFWDRDLG
ncbi:MULTISPECIES: SMI1/KNR4 family protein [unclassified Actinomadura]|uniref:SMI1/KNR4 family protein n=1 Tax=unclassified Actinomadura TaxID=2626254 RepID=UPI0011EE54D3|nr:SMI1/KNR4 family protein [Actinomadura sp. K4S16]